jgi:hypothetical protein
MPKRRWVSGRSSLRFGGGTAVVLTLWIAACLSSRAQHGDVEHDGVLDDAGVPDGGPEADGDDAGTVEDLVDSGPDVGDGGDGHLDADADVDGSATEDAGPDSPADGRPDVAPFSPEARDCTGSNECYVALDDGGLGCDMSFLGVGGDPCDVWFTVGGLARVGTGAGEWNIVGEPIPGFTLARDGSQGLMEVQWVDWLAASGACLGHCPYAGPGDWLYVLDVATGTVIAATAHPAVAIDAPPVATCEVDGEVPDVGPTGWCWRDWPEYDVRYRWRWERVDLPFAYEGSVIPQALHRVRISTGEELPPLDLPFLP